MNTNFHQKRSAVGLHTLRFLCISMVLITLLSPFSAFAFEFKDGRVIGPSSGDGDTISIPSSILGTPITSIESEAFMGAGIRNVYISEGVTEIGDAAFYVNHLKEVTLPASLTSIGDSAFEYLVDQNRPGAGTTFYVIRGSYAEAHVKQRYPYAKVISLTQTTGNNSVSNAPEKYSRYGAKLKGAGIYWIEKADLDRGMNAWNAIRSTYRAVSRFKFAELLNTHSLYCKTDFTYTQSTPDHFFTEECILRSPSGKIARYHGQNFLEGKERNWNWFWYNPIGDLIQKMYGQETPAETGMYTYELYFDGQLVGSASFAVTD